MSLSSDKDVCPVPRAPPDAMESARGSLSSSMFMSSVPHSSRRHHLHCSKSMFNIVLILIAEVGTSIPESQPYTLLCTSPKQSIYGSLYRRAVPKSSLATRNAGGSDLDGAFVPIYGYQLQKWDSIRMTILWLVTNRVRRQSQIIRTCSWCFPPK